MKICQGTCETLLRWFAKPKRVAIHEWYERRRKASRELARWRKRCNKCIQVHHRHRHGIACSSSFSLWLYILRPLILLFFLISITTSLLFISFGFSTSFAGHVAISALIRDSFPAQSENCNLTILRSLSRRKQQSLSVTQKCAAEGSTIFGKTCGPFRNDCWIVLDQYHVDSPSEKSPEPLAA